jgi:hypothetical protein
LTIFTSTIAFLTTSSPIVVHSSPRSFSNHFLRSLRSRSSYLPYIILRLMDKRKGLIKSWSNICDVPSTTINTIGQNCYYLPSLYTTIPSKDLLIKPHGSDFANRSHSYGNQYFLRMILKGALRSKYSKNYRAYLAVRQSLFWIWRSISTTCEDVASTVRSSLASQQVFDLQRMSIHGI